MEIFYDKIIPITLMLTILSGGIAMVLKDPKALIFPVVILGLGVLFYLNMRNEKLNKAIAANQAVKCGEKIYLEYKVNGDYLVSNGNSYNIVRGECSALEIKKDKQD